MEARVVIRVHKYTFMQDITCIPLVSGGSPSPRF